MDEAEWLGCTDPHKMLSCPGAKLSGRKLGSWTAPASAAGLPARRDDFLRGADPIRPRGRLGSQGHSDEGTIMKRLAIGLLAGLLAAPLLPAAKDAPDTKGAVKGDT